MEIALLYRSKLHSGADNRSSSRLLDEIRRQTGTSARKTGVSGFLLYADGYVYHLLEGGFLAVSTLFAAVLADARQVEVELLSSTPITTRAFGDWSMATSGDALANPTGSTAMKIRLLHDYAGRFGKPKPILRDILTQIAGEMTPAVAEPARPMAWGQHRGARAHAVSSFAHAF
ncbi:MAG: BLUF domain-containing [Beijerinckiaceae bacterium]|nr:MAG: BLUF domain-containing [Beijerinckiaceae bacterium]